MAAASNEPPVPAATAVAPTSTSGAAKPAGSGGGGTERKFMPLSHLTAQSARIGLWEVVIHEPAATSRKYLWEGKQRTSYSFQCKLVCCTDPTQYILADSHGKGITETKTKELEAKFKHGLVFAMSKVALAENMKRQYNSTPKSEVVCMARTKFDPVLAVGAGKPKMPEPPVPLAASMSIDREQQFDVLALIEGITETAPGGQLAGGQRRGRCTVTLIDGSKKKDTEKACLLLVTIFADQTATGGEPPLFQKLRESFQNKVAVAMFGIQGNKAGSNAESTWSFQSGFSFSFQQASGTAKGTQLESEATTLLAADAEVVPRTVLQSRSVDESTYADAEATETTCALLGTLLAKTKLDKIEVPSSFWQINWCRVYLPDIVTNEKPDIQQMRSNDGARLWFQVKVEDETGHLTLFIREKAALALAAVDSNSEFESAIATETLNFPQKASIKIMRKSIGMQTPIAKPDSVEKPVGDESQSQEQAVRCYIVEAAEQAMQDTPSKRSLDLIELLTRTDVQTNACVPAALSMIAKDPHYGLSVSYEVEGKTITKQCTKAVALVVASTPTISENLNDGYQMSTDAVQDPFTEGFVCRLLSFCTVKASPDYQLKPNRGQKTQTALVCIVDVLESGNRPVFLVEKMEKVEDADAELAPEHMSKRLYFAAAAAKMQGTSSSRNWTDAVSPANAGKCRRLGKSPTDKELDAYQL